MTVVLAGLLLASLVGVVQSQGSALQQAGSGSCEAGATYDPRCDVNRDGDTNYVTLVWAFIFEQAAHILLFLYLLVAGAQTFVQVGPPLIVAVIFLVLLLVFRR